MSDIVHHMQVPVHHAFINITPHVDECLYERGIQEGLFLVNAMHIASDPSGQVLAITVFGL